MGRYLCKMCAMNLQLTYSRNFLWMMEISGRGYSMKCTSKLCILLYVKFT